MGKPDEIQQLEQIYRINLKEVSKEERNADKNYYTLDSNRNVIYLDLTGNEIQTIRGLEKLTKLQQLNLSSNEIDKIQGLDNLTDLQILNLSKNKVTQIEGLEKLIKLQELDFSHNQINQIQGLEELTKLQELCLSLNQINQIQGLEKLTNLQTLDFSYNQIDQIQGLEKLTKLQELNLSANQINQIQGLDRLANLQTLDFSNNQINQIQGLDQLVSLQELALYNNQIQQIQGLDQLTNLQVLNLSGNQINQIQGLEKLTKLQELDLFLNKINQISGLDQLVSLQGLALSYNQIQQIQGLEKLTKLQELQLFNNEINQIQGLEKLTKLQELYLQNNKIDQIQGLEKLTNLQELNLDGNQINQIQGLDQLVKLQELYFSYNQINQIQGLDRLVNLQKLDLYANQIKQIQGLDRLINLQTLNLYGNQIQQIQGLDQLANLQTLKLSENQIEEIEYNKELEQLIDRIKYLSIDQNPFVQREGLPLKNNKNQLDDFRSYLLTLQESQINISLPVKVMLLGNHAAGKSSLLHYLLKNKLEASISSTHILDIQTYPETYDILPEAIIYDFGGQDYYHGLYQAFFSTDAINLLLWCNKYNHNAIRKCSNDLFTRDYTRDYWLHQLLYAFRQRRQKGNHREEGSSPSTEPLLLIQTHADKTGQYRQNLQQEAKQFQLVDEFYISLEPDFVESKKVFNLALQYLKESLLEEIQKKRIPEQRPQYYEQFLTYMLEQNKNGGAACTPVSEIAEHFEYKGNAEDKTGLLKFELRRLAQKGMVLYYDYKGLDDVAWLNPSATIQYIHSEVLPLDKIKEFKGKITKKEFDTLRVDNKIKQLLIQEQVIFHDSPNSKNERYIIPGYLPLAANDDTIMKLMVFELPKPCFILKFEYFIPFGLINRLICHYGNKQDLKYYRRDQLIFTYLSAFKIRITLDLANLEINVYIAQQNDRQSKLRLSNVKEAIFRDIICLYNNHADYTDTAQEENPEKEEKNEQHKKEKTALPIESPEDLYLSVDGKYFAHHQTIEGLKAATPYITCYGLTEPETATPDNQTDNISEKKRDIDKLKSRVQPTFLYKNFTNNPILNRMKKIFISYSREDVDYKDELKKHLGMLKLFNIADNWSCEEIIPGKWDEQIQEELNECDLIVYMLSSNFFLSPYIREHEIHNVMQGIKGSKKIVCVVVSRFVDINKYTDSKETDLTSEQESLKKLFGYQYLPYGKENKKIDGQTKESIKPLKRWDSSEIEEAYVQIVEKIAEALKD